MAEHRISISEARSRIHGLLHDQADPYVLTRAGVPTAVLLDYEEYSSLKALAVLMTRSDVVLDVTRGQCQILAGKKISLEDAMQTLGQSTDDSTSGTEGNILGEPEEDPIPRIINELNDLEDYYKAGRLEPELIFCLSQNLAQIRSLTEVVQDEAEIRQGSITERWLRVVSDEGQDQSEQLQAESPKHQVEA